QTSSIVHRPPSIVYRLSLSAVELEWLPADRFNVERAPTCFARRAGGALGFSFRAGRERGGVAADACERSAGRTARAHQTRLRYAPQRRGAAAHSAIARRATRA